MSKDEIMTMAREAGACFNTDHGPRGDCSPVEEVIFSPSGVERFAALVAAKEREACIKLIEPSSEHRSDPSGYIGGQEVVEMLDGLCDVIRSRGTP